MSDAQTTNATEQLVDSRSYRNVIGIFATGVTVVAAGEGKQIRAMTANAVSSLSLNPLLILVCVAKKARMARHLKKQKGFSLNILRRDQEDLSNYFAGIWQVETPPDFKFISWQGGPLLKDCAAALGCERYEVLEGGDHWIIIGKVIAVHLGAEPIAPLLFYRGRYRELTSISEPEVGVDDSPLWAFPW